MDVQAPMFSIIIPVYNSEPFLAECLDSISRQSFTDYEVLLVDDGSTDRSLAICIDYSSRDKRFKYYHTEKGGVSKARNLGLDNATGEYVVFVDSDDQLLPDSLTIYESLIGTYHADIIKCGYIEDRESESIQHQISRLILIKGQDSSLILHSTEECGYSGFLWNTAFKRTTIGNVRFDESISWLENHVFSRQCFKQCGSILLSPEITYRYFIRQTVSLSNIKDPLMMIRASYKEYLSRIDLINDDERYLYEQDERLFYGRLSLATKLINTLSLKQKVEFLKLRESLFRHVPKGRIRYIRTLIELLSSKIKNLLQ